MKRTLGDLRELASSVNDFIARNPTDSWVVREEFERLRDEFLGRINPDDGRANIYTGLPSIELSHDEEKRYKHILYLIAELEPQVA